MKNTVTYLSNEDSATLAKQVIEEQDERIKKLRAMGAKSVEGISVDGNTLRSALNGED